MDPEQLSEMKNQIVEELRPPRSEDKPLVRLQPEMKMHHAGLRERSLSHLIAPFSVAYEGAVSITICLFLYNETRPPLGLIFLRGTLM